MQTNEVARGGVRCFRCLLSVGADDTAIYSYLKPASSTARGFVQNVLNCILLQLLCTIQDLWIREAFVETMPLVRSVKQCHLFQPLPNAITIRRPFVINMNERVLA